VLRHASPSALAVCLFICRNIFRFIVTTPYLISKLKFKCLRCGMLANEETSLSCLYHRDNLVNVHSRRPFYPCCGQARNKRGCVRTTHVRLTFLTLLNPQEVLQILIQLEDVMDLLNFTSTSKFLLPHKRASEVWVHFFQRDFPSSILTPGYASYVNLGLSEINF